VEKKILVGMSGGVDSAATALLLKRDGYDVYGLYLHLSGPENSLAQQQACELAQKLHIPFITLDGRDIFTQRVLSLVVSEYARGLTPNPCILCNPAVKFRLLFKVAEEKNIPLVATGHYARILSNNDDFVLARGRDIKKDQSYMLYRLPMEWLRSIRFPLGNMTKAEVREIASSKLPLWVVKKEESQDVCFAPQGLMLFLRKYIREETSLPGSIVDGDGHVLGKHQGLWRYTIGQRKGLGLSGGPWFVVGKNLAHNILYVSNTREHHPGFVQCVHPVISPLLKLGEVYMAQHRYRTTPFPVKVVSIGEDSLRVQVVSESPMVAPGQSLVLYNRDVVCGGGIIISSEEVFPCLT
jgi:tRNA-specific 2-thiouridylase